MKKVVTILVFLGCFALLWVLQDSMLRLKDASRLSAASPFSGKKPGEFVGTVLLGGLRNLVIDVTWLKAIKLNEQGDYYKLLAVYEAIALLQPHLPIVWEFNAHNMAFNISSRAYTLGEKELWIRRAIDFLEEGIRKNPSTYRLYDFMGFIYFFKVGKDDEIKTRFLKSGINPYEEALKYAKLASAQPDTKATVYTQQIHCLIKLWRFDEARVFALNLLRKWPEWISGGVVYHNRFEDFSYSGSVPFMRNMRLFKVWKEME